MINISDAVKEKLKIDYCKKDFSLVVNHSAIGVEGIYGDSLKITKQIMSETAEYIGCLSSCMEIKVSSGYLSKSDYNGAPVSLTMRVYMDDGTMSEYIPLFNGFVDSCEKSADGKWQALVCYDILAYMGDTEIYNAYKKAFKELGSPLTVGAFRTYIVEQGIKIRQQSVTLPNDEVKIKKRLRRKNMTALELMKHICQANGVYGYIDETGAFGYKVLSSSGPVEDIPYYRELTYSHSVINPIKKGMTFRTNNNDAGVHVDWSDYQKYVTTDWDDSSTDHYIVDPDDEDVTESAYIIQGNYIAYKLNASKKKVMLANMMRSIGNNITFRTYRAKCNGLPYLECGDRIKFTSGSGEEIGPFVITKRILEGTQIMTDTFECEINTDYDVQDSSGSVSVSNEGNYVSDISGSNLPPEVSDSAQVANILNDTEVMVVVSWDEATGILETTSKLIKTETDDTPAIEGT